MTSHVHLIVSVSKGELSDVIRDLKSFTSRQMKELLQDKSDVESRRDRAGVPVAACPVLVTGFGKAGKKNKRNNLFQFWQQHNHPIELSTNQMIDQRLEYVHSNPVEAGFVFKAEDWVWSSARQYEGEAGELDDLYIIERTLFRAWVLADDKTRGSCFYWKRTWVWKPYHYSNRQYFLFVRTFKFIARYCW
jgi:hypothetical protein